MADGQTIDKPSDTGDGPAAVVKYWQLELDAAAEEEEAWRKTAAEVVKRYRDERKRSTSDKDTSRFNILFSNTETLLPALYSRIPTPDVRRRYRDADPVGKEVATVIERALSYCVDVYDFDSVMQAVVKDALLPGRGIAWVKYEPTIGQVRQPYEMPAPPLPPDALAGALGAPLAGDMPTLPPEPPPAPAPLPDGVQRAPDGSLFTMEERVVDQSLIVEEIAWDDFRMSPCRNWRQCRWVARRLDLDREELERLFGEVGAKVPLNKTGKHAKQTSEADKPGDPFRRAEVWQIWDKRRRRVLHVCLDHKEGPLNDEDDPLNLTNFFPCPDPLYMIRTNDTMVPVPEYTIYEDQALELDRLTQRIGVMIKAVRNGGVYDSSLGPELKKLWDATDNELTPVDNWPQYSQAGGAKGAVDFLPLEQTLKALAQLYTSRDQVKQTIFEITGLSDILRGATKAAETATAQDIKSRWGSLRLQRRQKEVQRFARDLFRIKAEIIAEKFQPEILEQMTGVPVTPDMLAVMRDDLLRSYRVDIETDSTIAEDLAEDQRAITELLRGVVEFMNAVAPLVQAGALPLEAAKAMVLAAVRRAKLGRAVEDAIDQIGQVPAPPMMPPGAPPALAGPAEPAMIAPTAAAPAVPAAPPVMVQ